MAGAGGEVRIRAEEWGAHQRSPARLNPETALVRAGESGPSNVHHGPCGCVAMLTLYSFYERLTAKEYLETAQLLLINGYFYEAPTDPFGRRRVATGSLVLGEHVPRAEAYKRLWCNENRRLPTFGSDYSIEWKERRKPHIVGLRSWCPPWGPEWDVNDLREFVAVLRRAITGLLTEPPPLNREAAQEWDLWVVALYAFADYARAHRSKFTDARLGRHIANAEVIAYVDEMLRDSEAAKVLGFVKPSIEDATDKWFDAHCDKLLVAYGSRPLWTATMGRLSEALQNRFVLSPGASPPLDSQARRIQLLMDHEVVRVMETYSRAAKRAAEAAAGHPMCFDATRFVPWHDTELYFRLRATLPNKLKAELDRSYVRSVRGLRECLRDTAAYPRLKRLVHRLDRRRRRSAAAAGGAGAGGGRAQPQRAAKPAVGDAGSGRAPRGAAKRVRGGGAGAGAPRAPVEGLPGVPPRLFRMKRVRNGVIRGVDCKGVGYVHVDGKLLPAYEELLPSCSNGSAGSSIPTMVIGGGAGAARAGSGAGGAGGEDEQASVVVSGVSGVRAAKRLRAEYSDSSTDRVDDSSDDDDDRDS